MFSVFCMLGVALSGPVPLLGVAVTAFAAEVLFVNRRSTLVYICVVLGACCCASFGPSTALTVLVVGLACVFTAKVCAGVPSQGRLVAIGVLQILLTIAVDLVFATMSGSTLWDLVGRSYDQQVQYLVSNGVFGADQQEVAQSMRDQVVGLWPVIYLFQGFVLTGISVFISLFSRRRTDFAYRSQVPPFAQFDFSPHIVWPIIAGLVCIALSYASQDWAVAFKGAGITLIVAGWFLVFVQGLALVEALIKRTRMPVVAAVLMWIAALALELITQIVSLFGLLDIWINFRHLPRVGSKYEQQNRGQNGA